LLSPSPWLTFSCIVPVTCFALADDDDGEEEPPPLEEPVQITLQHRYHPDDSADTDVKVPSQMRFSRSLNDERLSREYQYFEYSSRERFSFQFTLDRSAVKDIDGASSDDPSPIIVRVRLRGSC